MLLNASSFSALNTPPAHGANAGSLFADDALLSSTAHKGQLAHIMQEEGLTLNSTPSSGASSASSAVQDFSGLLTDSLNKLSQVQTHANTQAEAYAVGDPNVSLHDVMSASTQAELSLQAALQVRNKLVSAYQDIMRMPL
ncbi:MAG: flagellar hook-basal body complex protein FliE [Vampirovibrionales bacterium]